MGHIIECWRLYRKLYTSKMHSILQEGKINISNKPRENENIMVFVSGKLAYFQASADIAH